MKGSQSPCAMLSIALTLIPPHVLPPQSSKHVVSLELTNLVRLLANLGGGDMGLCGVVINVHS